MSTSFDSFGSKLRIWLEPKRLQEDVAAGHLSMRCEKQIGKSSCLIESCYKLNLPGKKALGNLFFSSLAVRSWATTMVLKSVHNRFSQGLGCLHVTALPDKGADADPLNGLRRVAKYGALGRGVKRDPLNGLRKTSPSMDPSGCLGCAERHA